MSSSSNDQFVPSKEDLENPCQVCDVVYNGVDDMVECEVCLGWFHYKCVGLDASHDANVWTCKKCVRRTSKIHEVIGNINSQGKPSKGESSKTPTVVNKANGDDAHNLETEAKDVDGGAKTRGKVPSSRKSKDHPDEEITRLRQLLRKQHEQLSVLVEAKSHRSDKSCFRENISGSRTTFGGKNNRGNLDKLLYDSSSDDDEHGTPTFGESSRTNKIRQKNKQERYQDKVSSDTDSDRSSTSSNHNTLNRFLAQQEMRELPSFDGCPTQWPSFFRTYMDSKHLFSHAANRNRLQKALTGKALKAVSGLLLSPLTIEDAIDMLKFRFGQSESIIQEAIDHAMAAEAPSDKKPESIVDYAMLIVTLNANIVAVGDAADNMNPILIKKLVERLPLGLQRKWSRRKRELKSKGKLVKISTFSKWLLRESQDYVDMIPNTPSSGNDNKSLKGKKSINLHQLAHEDDGKKENHKVCLKCSSVDHLLSNCKEFKQMNFQDRKSFVQTNQICFVCLKKGHRWRKCYKKGKDGRRVFHEMMREPKTNLNVEIPAKVDMNQKQENVTSSTLTHYHNGSKTLFKIVPVVLYGPHSQLSTFALLDDCASITLIEEKVANKLNLKGPVDPLQMSWTKDITSRENKSRRVKFQISGCELHSPKYSVKNARTVQNLALPSQSLSVNKLRAKYPYLEQARLDDLRSAVPTVLIGLDNTNLIAPLETKIDPDAVGPVAIRTKLGWSVHGPEHHDRFGEKYPTFLICECNPNEDSLDNMVEEYFAQENFGVSVPGKIFESSEDRVANEILHSTTKRIGNRFETGLLFKTPNIVMPDNFAMCLRRLISIELKMEKHPSFQKSYCDKIDEYVHKGYARKLSSEEVDMIRNNMWLLPHFGVVSLNKPKLRIVFDARAVSGGVSLNSQLLTGPDQYNSLVGVLYKFRQGRIAVAADIKEMFHQVLIREQDRRFQCFLWRNGNRKAEPGVYMMDVMIFGATCSPCSAQFVKNVNAKEHQSNDPRAVEAIIDRFYVDDFMDSFRSEQEALEVTKRVISINRTGGFELRHVISNSKMIMNQLADKTEKSLLNLNINSESVTEKVLGLYWDVDNDEFVFKLTFSINTDVMTSSYTKRQILKLLMSIFDPLGLLTHYVVRAKILLQEVWMRRINEWDVVLPEDICRRWLEWLDGLKEIERLRIKRCYSNDLLTAKKVDLHVFTDASERAFAAVAYMRIESKYGVRVCLISGKSKIASQKSNKVLSMPRLELQGGLLGCRLASMIRKEHSIVFNTQTFWTDSQTLLSWINTEYATFKAFVSHRIAEILESSQSNEWRFIPTKENPADDATKPNKIDSFDMGNRWYQGPSFLGKHSDDWPVEQPKIRVVNQDDPEIRRVFIVHQPRLQQRNIDYQILDLDRYGDWLELRRITAWLRRAVYNWKAKCNKTELNVKHLSLMEVKEAENFLIKKSQYEAFNEELRALTKLQPVSNKSRIRDLIPFLDETGIIRMDGRIESSPIAPITMKKPIILDKDHTITQLIIKYFHEKCQHQFQEEVVNEIRTHYWIPKLRVAVKQIKKKCQHCKNESVLPRPPQMSKLPTGRLSSEVGCFYHCGIDLFGPMLVPVKRSKEKRWGVIFTCLTIRAIYIELVPDLSADSLILSIRNRNARRGPIGHLYSDCGTNMKGADNELNAALREIPDDVIQRECIKRDIYWHFNPPASPHMGGCWERMVRSVKSVLNKLLKERFPREHTLRSLLCEVEEIINLRPLTYIALEHDSDDALTPKHFLNPHFRSNTLPLGQFSEQDLTSRKQWRMVQELSNHFWRRWVIEYLPMLNRTTKWHQKTSPVREGDIAVICDTQQPKNTWEKGRIVSVNKSQDGTVRSAVVKTKHGLLTRPVVKLAILDVNDARVNAGAFTEGGVKDDSNFTPKS